METKHCPTCQCQAGAGPDLDALIAQWDREAPRPGRQDEAEQAEAGARP